METSDSRNPLVTFGSVKPCWSPRPFLVKGFFARTVWPSTFITGVLKARGVPWGSSQGFMEHGPGCQISTIYQMRNPTETQLYRTQSSRDGSNGCPLGIMSYNVYPCEASLTFNAQ